jgi:adenylate cyclase
MGENMTRFTFLRVANAMLTANFISNAIGVVAVFFLTSRAAVIPPPEIEAVAHQIHRIFLPLAFFFPIVITLVYEAPIRQHLRAMYHQKALSEELTVKARRRLLNEPFFLIVLDFGIWLAAATVYAGTTWLFEASRQIVHEFFFRSIYTGLITTTIAFFVFEFVLQRRVAHFFFPSGRLYMTPRTIRIRIRTRLIALLFASNLIPFFIILHDLWGPLSANEDPVRIAAQLKSMVSSEIPVFMIVGIWLTFLVSSNLTRPLAAITSVLQNVRNGLFDKKVPVVSNDEIGYAGDVINEMTEGLKERDFIKETFGKYVSKEIRDEILSGNISLDGELKEVTVLFSDLRNFTPMVEALPPKAVVKIINGYFQEMEEAIKLCHGLVLQYIGDEIEAVFGAPIYRADHPVMAVQAALAMRQRLESVNAKLGQRGYPPLAHGIGIHTGEVVAANIGSPDRLSYTLVGDTVNLASRLQELNKELKTEIIISAATSAHLNGEFPLKEIPARRVKGKSEPVEIFSLL